MSDDISDEIQRVVNNIEDDKSRRRRLQSDIEDLYRGYTSLEDQVESLNDENRHYRKQFEKAVKGIDRQLEKNEHRLDTHERRLNSFRSDLDYLRKNGVGGSSRRSFLTDGIFTVLGAAALGTFAKAGFEAYQDEQRIQQIKSDDKEDLPVANPDFSYTDTELEKLLSDTEQLPEYQSELRDMIELSGNKVYGSYKTSDSEYIIETQYEEMVIDEEFWNALYSYHE